MRLGAQRVDGHARVCTTTPPSQNATIVCHPLSVPFVAAEATWNERQSGTPWTQGGADAVPEDREATVAAEVTFTPDVAPYEPLPAELDPILAAEWITGGSNLGVVCVGDQDPVPVTSFGSNCPPVLEGHLGRPLP